MTEDGSQPLSFQQLATLESVFHRGAAAASAALAQWTGRPSVVEVDSLRQLLLEDAAGVLATGDEPICFCVAEMNGALTGEMVLAFDDASGMTLADILTNQPPGSTNNWNEMSKSAALETANILCCVYLNSLSEHLTTEHEAAEILPSPPRFGRDFAESLLECALMGQAVTNDQVVLAQTKFEIDELPVNWTLLLIPDSQSMKRLVRALAEPDQP